MDVPLFPAPPRWPTAALETLEGTVGTSPSDLAVDGRAENDSRTTFLRRTARKRHAVHGPSALANRRLKVKPRLAGKHRNLVHPRTNRNEDEENDLRRVQEDSRFAMTERRGGNDDEDDRDVVCVIDSPTTISEELSPHFKSEVDRSVQNSTKSTGSQTIVGQRLRLRVVPVLKDIVDEENASTNDPKASSAIWRHLRFLGRMALSQLGLLWLLCLWAMIGAAAFCATEGPREREQVSELKDMQKDLAVGLATELRQLRTERDQDVEPLWSDKVRQYVAKHEKLLLIAVSSGYGEGGDDGRLWTFPGCVLFAVSLLTTLGFGAPVPRTTAGRTVAVVFAAIGIPAHFLLVMNFGILLAVRLQKYAMARKNKKNDSSESSYPLPVPKWVKFLPFVCVGSYYVLGILGFGVARARPFAASLLFPLDFTAAGGLATTLGHVRILYAVYLEGAVAIAAVAVAVLRVSATQSLTNIGLKYGLLTEA